MRVSLPYKMKPDSYTESCAVNSERSNHCREVMLSAQKSAEAIVAESFFSAKG